MAEYYDGSTLLRKTDINRKPAEIVFACSNRSAGKTTYFTKMLVDDYIKNGHRFCVLYRYAYECVNVADKFFSAVQDIFYQDYYMTQKTGEKDTYLELYLHHKNDPENEMLCGFAVALTKSDQLKRCSNRLAGDSKNPLEWIYFDEFQPENGDYAPNEISRFQSIHTSLARGGKDHAQSRFLKTILVSNYVSVLNPYFTALGISSRLQDNTKFLRGDGWVLEQGFNASASNAQRESAFNRAFANTDYTKYATERAVYLKDDTALVKKMTGENQYILTFVYNKKEFAIRLFFENDILYVSNSVDSSHPRKYAINGDDMREDTILIKGSSLLARLREKFECGAFRFSSLEAKEATFALLSY